MGDPSLASLSHILQSSFKGIHCDQSKIESPKMKTIHIFWGDEHDFSSFFQNLEIYNPCDTIKSKLGLIRAKFVYNIPNVIIIFFSIKVSNSFLGTIF